MNIFSTLYQSIRKGIRADAVDMIRDNVKPTDTVSAGGERPAPGQPRAANTDEDLLWAVPSYFNSSGSILGSKNSNVFLNLRQYAEMNTVIQYCIEQRQLQIAQMTFTVRYKDKRKERDERCDLIESLLNCPNRSQSSFFEFMMAFMHDLLVLDAVAIKPLYDVNGDVVSLELLDAAYVSIKVDGRGQIPNPPSVAYQFSSTQNNVIKNYTAEDLLYIKMHPRTSTPYGQSSVEKCLNTLKSLLERRKYQDDLVSEGNLPTSMLSVSEKMTPAQIQKYQMFFNQVDKMTNNKVKLIPHDWKLIQAKNAEIKLEIDELYTREICAIFNVAPGPLVSDVNRATAESNRRQAISSGNIAYIKFVENAMTRLINLYFGYRDLEFSFIQEDAIDPLQQAQSLQLYTGGKPIMRVNEARSIIGLGPDDELDSVSTSNNPINASTTVADESSSDINTTGENRLEGQADVKTSPKTAPAELPNYNEDR